MTPEQAGADSHPELEASGWKQPNHVNRFGDRLLRLVACRGLPREKTDREFGENGTATA